MKESHGEGLATPPDPESCVIARKGEGEALTGTRAGWVLSREIHALLRKQWTLGDADAVEQSGRQYSRRRSGKTPRNPARSETPRMYGTCSPEAMALDRRFEVGRCVADRFRKFNDVIQASPPDS
jgi:hypothetical protein